MSSGAGFWRRVAGESECALGGGRTHTWKILSRLLLRVSSRTFWLHGSNFLDCLPFDAGNRAHLL